MTDSDRSGTLVLLSDTDLTVSDPAEDVRGRKVLDRNREEIGEVDDLLLDQEENKVRFLRVGHGGFLGIGEDHFLVPVDAVTRIDEDHVHIDREKARLGDVPGYSPDLTYDTGYYNNVYGYWGYGPYWSSGYAYPRYPFYPF